MPSLFREALAELIGTAMLLIAVVGSGIMGTRLSGGNDGLALLANSIATGGALVALIGALGPVSGAHFNPAVTLFIALRERRHWGLRGLIYTLSQLVGAIMGVVLAHAMFDLELVQSSSHTRASEGELLGELIATFGLIITIWGVSRTRPDASPGAVASFVVGAYWFTSSTSFANPAVTLARSLTDTFAGTAPASVPGFVAVQLTAVVLAFAVTRALDDSSS